MEPGRSPLTLGIFSDDRSEQVTSKSSRPCASHIPCTKASLLHHEIKTFTSLFAILPRFNVVQHLDMRETECDCGVRLPIDVPIASGRIDRAGRLFLGHRLQSYIHTPGELSLGGK